MEYTIDELETLRRIIRRAWIVWTFNRDKRLIPPDSQYGSVPNPSEEEMQVLLDWWKFVDDSIIAAINPE